MAIKLEKNKSISLKKESDSTGIPFIKVGLGWDSDVVITSKTPVTKLFGLVRTGEYQLTKKKARMDVDIDASIFLYNEAKKPIGECSYRNTTVYANGTRIIEHSGDERSGGKKGDDETIEVYLDRMLDTAVHYAYVVLNIYSPDLNFDAIQNAYVNLYDLSGKVIADFNLTDNYEGKNGVIAAKLTKVVSSTGTKHWDFKALGDGIEKASRIDRIINRAMNY